MKLPLITLFLLSLLATSQTAPAHDNELVSFLRTFLKEIGEQRKVDELFPCISSGADIFDALLKALEEMSFGNVYLLRVGLERFFRVIQELLNMLSPCMKCFEKLNKLKEALRNLDLIRILEKIIRNTRNIFHFIYKGKRCLIYGDYACVGKAIGRMLCILVLNNADAKEFLKGFAEPINEKGDINKLVDCISEKSSIIDDAAEGIDLIMKANLRDFLIGLLSLIKAYKGIENIAEPCLKDFARLQQLLSAIRTAESERLLRKVAANPKPFVTDVVDFVEAVMANRMRRAGKDVGDVLFRLFLADEPV